MDFSAPAASVDGSNVSTLRQWPDAVLVARLKARDEATFRALVGAWSPIMLRLAETHVGSTATAEEVVQETWLAVIRGLDSFEGRSALRTWVLRICVNVAKRAGRRESRVRPSGLPTAETDTTLDPDRGPEALLLTAEVRDVLVEAVRALPERQAQVVALRDVHGLDGAEVAELIGITEGNVRVLLHRGRATLRQHLERSQFRPTG